MTHVALLMSEHSEDTALFAATGATKEEATAAVIAKQVSAYAAVSGNDDPAEGVQYDLDQGSLWVITSEI